MLAGIEALGKFPPSRRGDSPAIHVRTNSFSGRFWARNDYKKSPSSVEDGLENDLAKHHGGGGV